MYESVFSDVNGSGAARQFSRDIETFYERAVQIEGEAVIIISGDGKRVSSALPNPRTAVFGFIAQHIVAEVESRANAAISLCLYVSPADDGVFLAIGHEQSCSPFAAGGYLYTGVDAYGIGAAIYPYTGSGCPSCQQVCHLCHVVMLAVEVKADAQCGGVGLSREVSGTGCVTGKVAVGVGQGEIVAVNRIAE